MKRLLWTCSPPFLVREANRHSFHSMLLTEPWRPALGVGGSFGRVIPYKGYRSAAMTPFLFWSFS